MSSFEFYFSFYGLLLGLSVAHIATGIGNGIVRREAVRTGWLTPLLTIFVILDISSFWLWAWMIRDAVEVTYAVFFAGLLIAMTYFVAAVVLLPSSDEGWGDLNAHYWSNKRMVIGCIAAANLLMNVLTISQTEQTWPLPRIALHLVYWLSVATLFLSKSRRLDLGALGLLITSFAVSLWSSVGDLVDS